MHTAIKVMAAVLGIAAGGVLSAFGDELPVLVSPAHQATLDLHFKTKGPNNKLSRYEYLSGTQEERKSHSEVYTNPYTGAKTLVVGVELDDLRFVKDGTGEVEDNFASPGQVTNVFSWTGTGPFTFTISNLVDKTVVFSTSNYDKTSIALQNFEIARKYRWIVSNARGRASRVFMTSDLAPRYMAEPAGKVAGIRDLGGRIGLNGRRVRQNLLFRCSQFSEQDTANTSLVTDPRSQAFWRGLGIKTDLDLRGDETTLTSSPLKSVIGSTGLVKIQGVGPNFLMNASYPNDKKRFATMFNTLSVSSKYPLAFHCKWGKDRTGTLATMLLGVLGCDRDEVRKDWEATWFWTKGLGGWNGYDAYDAAIDAQSGSTFTDKVYNYLKSCGVSATQIEKFRNIMLEPEGYGADAENDNDEEIAGDEPDPVDPSVATVAPSVVAPNGVTVQTHTSAQSAFMALDQATRRTKFCDATYRSALAAGSRPLPTELSWTGDGSCTVVVKDAANATVFTTNLIGNAVLVDNLQIGATYTWSVTNGKGSANGSFETDATAPRLLRDPATQIDATADGDIFNVRDFGGRTGLDGKRVKTGLLYRSSAFDASCQYAGGLTPPATYVTDANRSFYTETLGIKTDVDLRNACEYGSNNVAKTTGPLGAGVEWVHFHGDRNIDAGEDECPQYGDFHKDWGKAQVKKFLDVFLDPAKYPVDFHCTSGQDRTGCFAFLLGGLLGVDENALYLDWELLALHNATAGLKSGAPKIDAFVEGFAPYAGATLQEKIEAYAKGVGVSDDQITAFRNLMLEGGYQPIPAHTHVWSAWTTNPAPTCVTAGTRTHTCTAEGCTTPAATESEEVSALDHDLGAWYTNVVPLVGVAGEMRRDCQRPGCDYYKTEVIPALDPVDPVDPTTPDLESKGWGYVLTGLGNDGKDVALVFTNTAPAEAMTLNLPSGVNKIWYLVVGGGGSGGVRRSNNNVGGGGGGAGGYWESEDCSLNGARSISVSVGAGGAAAVPSSYNGTLKGNNGTSSKLTFGETVVTAAGGGGGAGNGAGSKGGSGGGAACNGTTADSQTGGGVSVAGHGNTGGAYNGDKAGGGGGGGAGSSGLPGASTSSGTGGLGGDGLSCAITGESKWYCAGGAGGARLATSRTTSTHGGGSGGANATDKYNGLAATTFGSGGGGACGNGQNSQKSGAGYQGVVIVRYTASDAPTPTPEPTARTVTAGEVKDGKMTLSFGAGSSDLLLFAVWGATDVGDAFHLNAGGENGWDGFAFVARVPAATTSYEYTLPSGWGSTVKYVRFFMTAVDEAPVASLASVSGTDGAAVLDTGYVPTPTVTIAAYVKTPAGTRNQKIFEVGTEGANDPYLVCDMYVDANGKPAFNCRNSSKTSGWGYNDNVGTASLVTSEDERWQLACGTPQGRYDGTKDNGANPDDVPTAPANGTVKFYGVGEITQATVVESTYVHYLKPAMVYNASGELVAGFYDSITHKAFASATETPFTAGDAASYARDLLNGVTYYGDSGTIEYSAEPQPEEHDYDTLYKTLQTDGVGYILTDYVPTNLKTVKVEIKARKLNTLVGFYYMANANTAALAKRSSPNGNELGLGFWASAPFADGMAPGLQYYCEPGTVIFKRGFCDTVWAHTLVTDGAGVTVDDETCTTGETPKNESAGGPIALFCCSMNGSTAHHVASLRVQYVRVWEGGTLVRDWVPATKNGVATLYDKVYDKCETVLGGGAFTADNELDPDYADKPANSWTREPSMSALYAAGTAPTFDIGEARYGSPVATYTAAQLAMLDGGVYTQVVKVAETDEYRELAKSVVFTVTGLLPREASVAPAIVWPNGETVLTHTALQRAYLAKSDAERRNVYADAIYRQTLANGKSGPLPTALTWTGDGISTVTVTRVTGTEKQFLQREIVSVKGAQNVLEIENLEIGTVYRWTVENALGTATGTFTTDAEAPRLLRDPGPEQIRGVRDLGGRTGLDGKRVRQGLVFRSSQLGRDTDELNFINDVNRSFWADFLGIRTELDFRGGTENPGVTKSPIGDGVNYCKWSEPTASYGFDSYASYQKSFALFLDRNNYPIDFHCAAGQDRTGVFAFLLNALLGVSEDELQKDWEVTAFWNSSVGFCFANYDEFRANLAAAGGANAREQAENYVINKLKFTMNDINTFRDIMLEEVAPTPSKPTVDGKEVEPDKVFDTAASTKPIVYPAGSTVTLSGEVGAQKIAYGGKSVDVPRYYTATLSGNVVSLALNDFAKPVFRNEAGEEEKSGIVVAADGTVSLHIANVESKLTYTLVASASLDTPVADWTTVAGPTKGACDFTDTTKSDARFYRVVVTDGE